MALTVDWPNKLITVNQSDLTLISGTLYEMDTESYFRTQLMALADDDAGMAWPYPLRHNTEVTVAGTTYARTIEVINGYSVQFLPNSQWSVRLIGSNNNIWDVQNSVLVQNQVQVIPTNSAGLQTVSSGSGLSTEQDAILTLLNALVPEVWQRLDLDIANPNTYANDASSITNDDFDLTRTDNGDGTSTVQRS